MTDTNGITDDSRIRLDLRREPMNYSAILSASPWMTYAAAQATAMVTWFVSMAPSRATLDQSKAIAQRGLEQAYFNAKETWTSTELVNFRGEDKA